MHFILTRAERLGRDQRGLSTVEYVIVLMLIAVVGIVTWQTFGETLAAKVGIGTERIRNLDGEGSPSDSTTGGGETVQPQVKTKIPNN